MIRIVATFCFLMTLLCPVFCLADGDGDCSDHPRQADRNCEAMSVGAVVAEPESVSPPAQAGRPIDIDPAFAIPAGRPLLGGRWPIGARNRSNRRPMAAATRQALLQVFVF